MVVGAGGHARETAWVAEASGFHVVGFVVSDLTALTHRDSRERVLGDFGWLAGHVADYDAIAVGIGTPSARVRVADAVTTLVPDCEWPTLVHPSAVVDPSVVRLERGAYVGAGVIATVGIRLGPWSCLNFGCTVGHETEIGRGSVVNPGANISGGVKIGDEVLVGSGAKVLQYLRVGERAKIGAGAVVIRDVDPDTTVVGVPARRVVRGGERA